MPDLAAKWVRGKGGRFPPLRIRGNALDFSIMIRTFLLLILISLTACNGLTVEETPLKQAAFPPEDARPAPIGFNKVRHAIPTGTPLASYSPKGLLGLLKCAGPYTVVQSSIFRRSYPDDNLTTIFRDTMQAQGYDVTGDPGRLFDEQEDIMRSTYSIGARITDIKIDLCREVNLLGTPRGETGEASTTIEWSVYDLLRRKNVYKTTTKGYAKRRIPNHDGLPLLLEDSFAAAAHNVGADPAFHNLIFYGEEPQDAPGTYQDPYEEPALLFDTNEQVVIKNKPLSHVSAEGHWDSIKHTAVLIQAGQGHGSGFFLTNRGHIMTNAHVVGDAARVRVVSSNKKHKMIAEVLRVDRKRDVALLKLEEIPDKLRIHTLPIRTDKPRIGSTVFAIGTPTYKRLQDTLTKGIVSAHRMDARERQPYIQADVAIYGGNSGGPLLDEYGNLIGLAVSGYMRGDIPLDALNNFIPIQDGLEHLDIIVE